jgi:predicted CoA-binding protein
VTDHTRTILEKATTIAVVGLSTNDTKAVHAVPACYGITKRRQVPST